MTSEEVKSHLDPQQQQKRHMSYLVRALRAGCIWDEQLKKWMGLEDLLKHPDKQIRSTWEKSSEKEYGNLF